MKKEKEFKQELKYWLPIITLAVSVTVAFTTLQVKVDAMTSREQANKEVFSVFVKSTTDKLNLIIGNQIAIATELGINIERQQMAETTKSMISEKELKKAKKDGKRKKK